MASRPVRSTALERLHARQPVFGAIQTLPGVGPTEAALRIGYDFVILDCEQGACDEAAHRASLDVIAASPAFAAVRVRAGDVTAVARYIGLGADVIMMPNVATAAEAAAFVGAAATATDGPGPLLVAMIESRQAVECIGAIVATTGLDGIVIGPNDLVADLGCAGDFSAPAYQSAFAVVERTAASAGLFIGSAPHPGRDVARLIAAGHCFIRVGADIVALRDGLRTPLDAARRACGFLGAHGTGR